MTARDLALQVILLLLAEVALAQGPAPSPLLATAAASSPVPIAPASSSAVELTRADLEPFLDGLIASQIENRDVAGAVVAVVKDGGTLLSKGYGFADFGTRAPVLADDTLFRPGSISKVFTAVAVMQLVEQGKLDLDKDVREYLDFEIARKFPEPITLRRILTHTAGFEESIKNLFGSHNEPIRPLREYLVAHMPVQIFRPGAVPAYSNYAIAVAGYIVERIARQPLDQYLAKHVFGPLQMKSSTFIQPLPDELENRMSKGYTIPSKGAKAFEICNPTPAGAMTTTATDMTCFMRALLNGGTLDDATILRPETLALMQSRQFEFHPELRGMGLVFMEYSQNGRVIWGHGGDTVQFHSDMFLIPDARVGLFVSYNSGGARPGSGRGELQRAFLARYFPPAEITTPPKSADAVAHAREVAGVYEGSRKSEMNIFRITSLLGQQTVTADRDGILKIENAKNLRGQLKRWQEVAPYVYREINGPDRVAFRRDESGKVTDLLPNVPIYLAHRVPVWRSKSLLLPVVGGCLGFMALTVLLWPVAALIRRRSHRTLLSDSVNGTLFVLSRVVCLFWLGMIAALAIPLSRVDEDIGFIGDKIDPWLFVSHLFAWLAAAGLIILIIAAFRFWRTIGLGWWTRVHATLLMLAALVFLCFAWQWHMLSLSLKF